MRNIPINGVGVPILEGGDPTDFAPWMESYTNALANAIAAAPSVNHHTVRGTAQVTIPARAYQAGTGWQVGVSGAAWPGFGVSQPHTVASLVGLGGGLFNIAVFPTRTKCEFFAYAVRPVTVPPAPWNVMQVNYVAVDWMPHITPQGMDPSGVAAATTGIVPATDVHISQEVLDPS